MLLDWAAFVATTGDDGGIGSRTAGDGAAVIYAVRGDGDRVTHAAGTRDTIHDGAAGLEGSGNGTSARPPGGCKMEQQNHRVKRRRQTR